MNLSLTRQARQNFLSLIDGLPPEALNRIPNGFNNNLIWNLGHMIATQQLLCYGLSGTPFRASEELIAAFRKGTRPKRQYSHQETEEIKVLAISAIDTFEQDWEADAFGPFTAYPTSFGLTLHNLEEAIAFNAAHEALHLGYAMALKKAL